MKEKLGLDHFEGRSWEGLHLPPLMTMIAYAFLQHQRLHKATPKKRKRQGPPKPTLRDSHQSGYNLGSAGPLRHLVALLLLGSEGRPRTSSKVEGGCLRHTNR